MSKKFLTVFLVGVLLMTAFTSCNRASKSLTACGEDVISLMTEMLESDDYQSLFNLPAAYDEQINKLCEGNYSKSIAVYELFISEEEVLGKTIDKDALSEELYAYICSSAYGSFVSRINQTSGLEAMAVSTVFTAQKTYASKDIDANKIYLYVFENGCPIVISFISDGNGAFRAVGQFIINDTFVTDDEHSIEASLDAMKITGVTVTKQ